METNTRNKNHLVLVGVLAAVLIIGIIASCTLGAMALGRLSAQDEQISKLSETLTTVIGSNSDTVKQEDDAPSRDSITYAPPCPYPTRTSPGTRPRLTKGRRRR